MQLNNFVRTHCNRLDTLRQYDNKRFKHVGRTLFVIYVFDRLSSIYNGLQFVHAYNINMYTVYNQYIIPISAFLLPHIIYATNKTTGPDNYRSIFIFHLSDKMKKK